MDDTNFIFSPKYLHVPFYSLPGKIEKHKIALKCHVVPADWYKSKQKQL